MGYFDATKIYLIVGTTRDGKTWFGDAYIGKDSALYQCSILNKNDPHGCYHVMERKVADAG